MNVIIIYSIDENNKPFYDIYDNADKSHLNQFSRKENAIKWCQSMGYKIINLNQNLLDLG